jgi:hypothetical protein
MPRDFPAAVVSRRGRRDRLQHRTTGGKVHVESGHFEKFPWTAVAAEWAVFGLVNRLFESSLRSVSTVTILCALHLRLYPCLESSYVISWLRRGSSSKSRRHRDFNQQKSGPAHFEVRAPLKCLRRHENDVVHVVHKAITTDLNHHILRIFGSTPIVCGVSLLFQCVSMYSKFFVLREFAIRLATDRHSGAASPTCLRLRLPPVNYLAGVRRQRGS